MVSALVSFVRFVELVFDSDESLVSLAVSGNDGSDSLDSLERLDLEVVLFFFGSSSMLAVGVVEVELSVGLVASVGLLKSGLAVSTGFDSAGFDSSAAFAVPSPESLVVAVSSDFDFEREERDLDERFEVFSFGFSLSLPGSEPAAAASPVVAGGDCSVLLTGDGGVTAGVSGVGLVMEPADGGATSVVGEPESGGGTSDELPPDRLPAFAAAPVAGFAAGFTAGVVFFFTGGAAKAADAPKLSPAGPIRRQAESDTANSGCQVSSDTNNDRR